MIEAAKLLLDQLLKAHKVCPSHGFGHALRVLQITDKALKESGNPPNNSQDILLAALLHDADDRKLFGDKSNNTESILKQIGIKEDRIKSIQQMINMVSFSKNQGAVQNDLPIFAYYPRYSDRLQAIGEIGIVRAYTYGKGKGRKVFIQSTAKPLNRQQLSQVIKGRDEIYRNTGQSASMVDHFYDKIFHITCPEELESIPFYKNQFTQRKQQVQDFILEYTRKNFEGIEDKLLRMQAQFIGIQC